MEKQYHKTDDNAEYTKRKQKPHQQHHRHHHRPNVISYSSIIDCWSRSGSLDGAKRAQKLLDHMEYLHSSGENISVKPNVITYTSVLTAYARTNTIEGATRANELLNHMEDLYDETKDENVKPNVVSYFAVIDLGCTHVSHDTNHS